MRSSPLAATLVALCLLVLPARPAAAEFCGGGVACFCGDIVVTSTTLGADIGVCTETGLRVASGVTLDCAGHTITGDDSSNAKFGIHVDGATGATVRNCKVTGFRRGLRINEGSGNTLLKNHSFANKYGIDLAGGTTDNLIKLNLVEDSRDEGIHLGGAHRNRIIRNELRYNKRENLYLLRSDDNRVTENLVHHSDYSAIFVKHSSRNRFVRNTVRDTALQIRGDSSENVFRGNYLKGNGYLFDAYEEPTGWTHPRDNTMSADCIRKTDFCYRFFGATDNTATNSRTDGRCDPPLNLEARGGVEATGNSVALLEQKCLSDAACPLGAAAAANGCTLGPRPSATPTPTPTPTPAPTPD